jgi:acyl-CoA thioester hydrolase
MRTDPTTTDMPIKLVAQDLDSIGYIDTAAYLRWVQAVVIMHWERFAPEDAQTSTLWIAMRHIVTHRAPGRISDVITARTWIKRSRGVRAVFITIFMRDEQQLAEIESTWVCLDSVTKLPKALDPDVVCLFQ